MELPTLENPIDVVNRMLRTICNGSIRIDNDQDDAVDDMNFRKICVKCFHDNCLANIRYMFYMNNGILHAEIASYTKPGVEKKNLNILLRSVLVAYLYYQSRKRNEPIVLISKATNAISAYSLAKVFHVSSDNAKFNKLAEKKQELTYAKVNELYSSLRKHDVMFENNGLTIIVNCDNANSQIANEIFRFLIVNNGKPKGVYCIPESKTLETKDISDIYSGGKSPTGRPKRVSRKTTKTKTKIYSKSKSRRHFPMIFHTVASPIKFK